LVNCKDHREEALVTATHTPFCPHYPTSTQPIIVCDIAFNTMHNYMKLKSFDICKCKSLTA